MRFRERLFEGQLFVGEEGLLAAKCDLGDVGIVPARDEVLIALAACAMLAHDLNQRVGRNCGGLRRVKGDPHNTALRFHSRPTNKKCIMALAQMMQEQYGDQIPDWYGEAVCNEIE